MSGHVRSRGPNTWQVFVSVGTDPVTGRRRRVTRTVHGSRDAAEYLLWQLQVLDADERGTEPPAGPRDPQTTAPRRWPLEPLLAALRRPSVQGLAALLGIDARQVHRWKQYGLSDEWADRAAITLGLHPALVWPEW